MSTSMTEDVIASIGAVLEPYDGEVSHGNVRMRASHWEGVEGAKTTNVAIIYESPGGSTNQINVSVEEPACLVRVLNDVTSREESTEDVERVVAIVRHHVESIPEKRRQRLRSEIERWRSEGRGQREIFSALNQLFQCELMGGSITTEELQDATRYAIQLCKGESSTAGA